MSTRESIAVATRGSDLALRQARTVAERLEDHRIEATLVEVETTGDRIDDALIQDLGKTGAFVRALDERVLDGEVDAAVHSMKDVPTDQPDDIVVAAVPRRASPVDVLLSPTGEDLGTLPAGATVGTSSLRRGAQILARRPDLAVEPLRGNVDTRVQKLLAPRLQAEHERRLEAKKADRSDKERDRKRTDDRDVHDDGPTFERSVEEWFDDRSELDRQAMEREVDTEYDAIVLARAGLERSGLTDAVSMSDLSRQHHVPSAGQGALAVTTRSDSELAERLFEALDHPHSRVATTAERIVLDELGGGCVAPIGIHAHIKGDAVSTRVQVLNLDGTEAIAETRDLDVEGYAAAARDFAADLADRGARELIEEAAQ
ncbi:hydroxymethylbilane synthase [Halanaeroarchaeum sulfurireducens]|uniref:Hydroxymethylbilane synthase n=1 Tax=Halanaeroarchaeum sulfurireducens TaxID=1604004 RepID=A0A0F7PAD2_9EURY|nr:hydroxymethylbilane synthase [Halanaeroarchaeum sulfurireducens]AKH96589.1 hydroxymethylbilane synthase (porphobilinogen deaminase) [Halanaeroarchaeum sulfurireducens]ALG80991.1 hydroxymethylbilane synthase (porphobilinogen deaminase) [Halanaeroarchaeum sulfurireducens]